MDETFGAGLLSLLLQQLQAYRVSIGGQLAASFLGFFRMFVLLYVVFVGYRVMMGMMGARTKDATISIALVVLLHGLIAETSAFQAWIEEPIIGSALGLAQMFADAGSGGSHLFSRLDAAVSSIIGTVEKIEPGGNILTNSMIYIKVSLASLILLLAVCGLYLVYLAQVSLALVSMYLLMMIAAPFIFFAAFSETRFITWTWFKAVLNYAVWSVLLSLIMAVGVAGIEESARQLATWDVVRDGVFTVEYGFSVGFSVLMIYFLMKSSDLASSLTGGMGMQSNLAGGGLATAGSALGSGVGTAVSAVAPSARAGAGMVAQGASKAFSAMRGIGR